MVMLSMYICCVFVVFLLVPPTIFGEIFGTMKIFGAIGLKC